MHLMGVLVLALFFTACSKDDEAGVTNETVNLQFGPVLNDLLKKAETKQAEQVFPECSEEAPAYVRIVLSSNGSSIVGTEDEPFRIDLVDGQLFTEEVPELELVPGSYSLDHFAVYSEDDQLIWVAPRGGNMANLVDHPLPLAIELGGGAKKYVDVSVLCFDDRIVNEYGYLFFDIEGVEAIEFCLFGNYCDEGGRHFPAHFEVNVWAYSNGERGDLLYTRQNDVSLDENEDYAGTTVCVALPDSDGLDEYYFEISLLDSDAYDDIQEGVIRSGVVTDEVVRELFVGDDAVDYYHFREGNCGGDDSPDIFDEGVVPECDPEDPEADCDNDDIANADDDCPNTPSGTTVDDRGCELTGCDPENPASDCDNDGVSNENDDCPDSAAGAHVDENGCEACDPNDPNDDCDGDGVVNGEDQCLETDAGVDVDEEGCESITVPGRDIVVLNDINTFDPNAMEDPDNIRFVQNLVNFTTTGSRNNGSTFLLDTGRGNYCQTHSCGGLLVEFINVVEDEGFTVSEIQSTEGGLTEIPAGVKVLMLVMPEFQYTVDEINELKQFAAEGGRIIFLGEHERAYLHISVENEFLSNMGAVLHNTGGSIDCGAYFPAVPASGITHPIMEGVNEISIGCASIIEPGPDDFPLFYDVTGTYVLGGVAKIDTTPISEVRAQDSRHQLTGPKEKLQDPGSLLGF